ncbi:Ig-like V-type domain-containing protein FAM187A [Amphibalanus amphitrite]|uniref:Ig-like V-type domain-containing protein FAM187A n=1 Tax=Amphibalanus amphitrite TaxID=1232801 RepID=A0A6A4WMJ4_AMPAM|nr:Ig-like V-type domain-containing protein FAM187A [Amphibalanus amphitrite]
MASDLALTSEMSGAPALELTRMLWTVTILLAVLTAPTDAHPMLDAITNWVKKAGKTKLGQGIIDNFFTGGQLNSDETTEDPMEFEKQIWLAETGQVKIRKFVLSQRERGDYILNFRKYYKCISEKRRAKQTVQSTALVIKAGATISAHCPVCQYPNRGDASIWRRMLSKQTVTEDVPVDMDHFIVSPGMKLTLQGALPSDSGIYICQNYFTIHAVYNIDVVPFLHPKTVHGPSAPSGPYPAEPVDLKENNLRIFTDWSQWSSCSRCDRVGKRFRSGMCFVQPLEADKPIRLKPGEESLVAKSALEQFPNGLPCETKLLPSELRELQPVANRRAEREVRFCKVPCPNTRVWIVRDAYGTVREIWKKNNRSIVERLEAPLSSYVRRSTVYTNTGKKIRIVCSGSDHSSVVQWQKSSRLLDPVGYRRETHGRVFIDINKVIHIRKAASQDSGLYTCWQKDNMVASVQLVVEYNIYFKYKEYIVVIGISVLAAAIGLGILCMCAKSCYKRCGGGKKKPKMIIAKT